MAAPLMQCLLAHLVDGQSMNLLDLANSLEISRELLEQMLWDLERGGYIRQMQNACADGCQGCAHQRVCRAAPGGRIWVVTEKGRRVAERNRSSHTEGNARTAAFAPCTTCAHDE